jgi:RsiW-degrading membrane proteinase PrsW (M82 family)
MSASSADAPEPARRRVIPRWLIAWLLTGALAGTILLVAEVTDNWSIPPSAMFLGAITGPFAFCVWLTDRTRIGRSVAPDVLFTTWLVGGGVAILFAGIFESDFFYRPVGGGYLWIGLVEETAKVVAPFAICTWMPKYRSVPQALALGIATAAGFAVFESMAYAFFALDESIREAHDVLVERSIITPFGHLPWTGLAVIVAAREWDAAGRIRLTPKALWGLGVAIVLHTMWNLALIERGWWYVLVPVIAVATFGLFFRVLTGVYYSGGYAVPPEHPARRWRRRGA